jgi:hypothetical protein
VTGIDDSPGTKVFVGCRSLMDAATSSAIISSLLEVNVEPHPAPRGHYVVF